MAFPALYFDQRVAVPVADAAQKVGQRGFGHSDSAWRGVSDVGESGSKPGVKAGFPFY